MAYLSPHFEADAFVSYSQGDPLGQGDAPLKQWTLALIQRAEKEIRSIDPEFADVVLWRDEEIDPTRQLTPALRAKVAASYILIIVMSRHYLKSSWCGDELKWFSEQIRDRDSGRVFILRAQPTDVQKWPEFLRDERGHAMLGFKFCEADAEFPYGWPDFLVQTAELRKEQNRLVTALMHRLREFKKELPPPPSMAAPLLAMPEPAARQIFLHASRAHEAERDALKTELKQDGFRAATLSLRDGGATDFGQEERRKQLEWMRKCDAVALATFDGGAADEREFEHILETRKDLVGPRGQPLPCVVIDRSGGRLSVDPTDWGTACIDATRPGWRGELRAWLGGAP